MMSELSSNQYVLEEVFAASACEVFQHLTRLGSVYSLDAYSPQVLSPATTPCTALSGAFGVGFTWSEHRRHLFLRDLTQLEVVHCEAPAALTVVSNDGFNQLKYDFKLTQLTASSTAVRCTVHCYTHSSGQGQLGNPSEKLAIMMRNQDRLAIRQLKGAVESGHALSVC